MAKPSNLAIVCLMVVVMAAAIGAAAAAAEQPGCFCDCMRNRCMTLGTGADKFDCSGACTDGCEQIGQPGQPTLNDFCGF